MRKQSILALIVLADDRGVSIDGTKSESLGVSSLGCKRGGGENIRLLPLESELDKVGVESGDSVCWIFRRGSRRASSSFGKHRYDTGELLARCCAFKFSTGDFGPT